MHRLVRGGAAYVLLRSAAYGRYVAFGRYVDQLSLRSQPSRLEEAVGCDGGCAARGDGVQASLDLPPLWAAAARGDQTLLLRFHFRSFQCLLYCLPGL